MRWQAMWPALGLALAALAFAASGCGGDDEGPQRLTKQEFAERLREFNKTVTNEFEDVFEALQDADPSKPLNPAVQQQLEEAAQTEREVIEDIEALSPPKDAEAAVNSLIPAAREQADDLEAAANDPDLTGKDLRQVFEGNPEVEEALDALRRLGYPT